ncbi:MAG: hypothetical protein ACREDS_06495, partial [Limisphaerales bacterium]
GGYGLHVADGREESNYFMLGLLNSKILDHYVKRISSPFRGGYFSFARRFIEKLPIPDSDETQRQIVERLVDHLLWLHRQPSVAQADHNHPQDPLIASYFEQTVNALVYELFFPQELHTASLHCFDLVTAAALPAPDQLPPETAARLDWHRQQFKKWSAPGHPLRVALDKLQTLDLVRIIEGHA